MHILWSDSLASRVGGLASVLETLIVSVWVTKEKMGPWVYADIAA